MGGVALLRGRSRWSAVPTLSGRHLDGAGAEGFSAVLLVGHIGKLVKLAGGIMNTHSRWADGRAELFCAHAALCGADRDTAQALMDSATADQCLSVLERQDFGSR
ncbi:MAG: hypothetical protein ACLUJG_14280 [Lawsonibacter sp.]